MNRAGSRAGRRMATLRSLLVVTLALLALVTTAGPAQAVSPVVARVRPTDNVVRTGDRLVVSVDVDMGPSGQRLGAYGASFFWVPSVVRFVSYTGGSPPFDSPQVNTDDAGGGLLRFVDADPTGAAGVVNLINIAFDVIAASCATSFLSLQFDTMSTASTFEDLLPVLTVVDGTASVLDVPIEVRVSDPLNTFLEWTAVPGAMTYDVIRGHVEQLRDSGTAVSLGAVTCIEDDSLDTTTSAGMEASNPDTEAPLPGRAFFYLVRFSDGADNSTYGFPRRCDRERIPESGDCP